MHPATRIPPAHALILVALSCACEWGDSRRARDDSLLDASAADALIDAPSMPPPLPTSPVAASAEPPIIPVGLDAYRQWDRWPALRIGMRATMTSTYDRAGGNEAADASHFVRQEAANAYVPLDVVGPGVLTFVRTNHWHGSPWHYRVDARDVVVQESSTSDPDHPKSDSVFLPEAPFPPPLALPWVKTSGADLMAVPIAFERSLSIAYERSHYGTGYYIYDSFPEGATNLSQPIHAWDATPPAADVVSLIARAGDDIAPAGDGVHVTQGVIDLLAGGTVTLLDLSGARTIRALRFTVPIAAAVAFGRARLRVTWDDRAAPSIDAPVALFFGTGTLYNRSGREHLVKSFPMVVREDGVSATLSTYFPMPFLRHARIELVGAGDAIGPIAWHVRSVPNNDPSNHLGYFHATYVDHGVPSPGRDLVLLDTSAVEGGGAFCGSFVGTSVIFSDVANLATLEGDPRFFFDGSRSPQGQGTGTEEWGGGGDYWGGATTTLPFVGHPVGAAGPSGVKESEDAIESMYRFLLSDLFPFGASARIQLEHGGWDDSTDHYRTVAYWYGLPDACLVETDALDVGDVADEARHRYLSPDASAPESLTSRFQAGVDHVDATEVIPTMTEIGRHTTGTTELTMHIAPSNLGVLLRRLDDCAFVDQKADVFVSDDRDGAPFVRAGTWYAAGSNSVIYANAPTETGADPGVVQTSDRRWREDEMLLPRALTEGRDAIRVRLVFVPAAKPLVPGGAVGMQGWSEFRYRAFVWRMPGAPL